MTLSLVHSAPATRITQLTHELARLREDRAKYTDELERVIVDRPRVEALAVRLRETEDQLQARCGELTTQIDEIERTLK